MIRVRVNDPYVEPNTYDKRYSGDILLSGNTAEILRDYRVLTRVICDRFGPDVILSATLGVKFDDIKMVKIDIREEGI